MFYIQQDEKIVLFDDDKQKLLNTLLFMPQYAGLEIKETDRPIADFQFADTEEYQQEQAEQEAERISMLNLTAADVERAVYKAKGIDFDDVITLIESSPLLTDGTLSIDLKALKIELKANNFYRGNAYIDTVGSLLGFTKEQLDLFFDTKDYKYLTTVTLTINPTPTDAVVTINDVEQRSITIPYGATVEYSVIAEGYFLQSGSIEVLTEDKTIDVELTEDVTQSTLEEDTEIPAAEDASTTGNPIEETNSTFPSGEMIEEDTTIIEEE